MVNRIIAAFFLIYIAVTSAIFFVIALVIRILTGPFDRRLVVLHLFTSFWACLYLWTMPAWRLSLEGREKIRRRETYLIVSNHQSQLDILVAFRLFFPFKWVSKAEVFKLPFVGWNMVLNDYVKLRRGHKESIERMMAACRRHLARGSSVFFFPEGTPLVRRRPQTVQTGAFVLAHEMGLPILPVAIDGTRLALPKYSLNFHGRHHIRLQVLDPIAYDAFKHLSVAATAEMVRGIIAAHVSGGQAR